MRYQSILGCGDSPLAAFLSTADHFPFREWGSGFKVHTQLSIKTARNLHYYSSHITYFGLEGHVSISDKTFELLGKQNAGFAHAIFMDIKWGEKRI
jgi:hypothetical protein